MAQRAASSCHPHETQIMFWFLPEPHIEILNGPEVYLHEGSTLNLTCVISPAVDSSLLLWSRYGQVKISTNSLIHFEPFQISIELEIDYGLMIWCDVPQWGSATRWPPPPPPPRHLNQSWLKVGKGRQGEARGGIDANDSISHCLGDAICSIMQTETRDECTVSYQLLSRFIWWMVEWRWLNFFWLNQWM